MSTVKYLSAAECRIVRAISDAVLPRGGAFEVGGADVDTPGFVDRYVGEQDRATRLAIRFLIHQWNWLPILYFFSRRRFFSMDLDERVRFMERVAESRIFLRRAGALMFKLMVGMSICSDPRVEAAIGYVPHCAELVPGRGVSEERAAS